MEEEKNKGGRPTEYQPKFNSIVYKMCLLGCKDSEIADAFGVTEQTINNWKRKYPRFFESIKKGKIEADYKIAESLYKRGLGYNYTETKVQESGTEDSEEITVVITKTKKHVPGDVGAAMAWLKNRRPQDWRDRKDLHISENEQNPFDNFVEWGEEIEEKESENDDLNDASDNRED